MTYYAEEIMRSFQWQNCMQTAITTSKCSVHPSGIKFEAKFRDTQWTDITLVVQLGNGIVIILLSRDTASGHAFLLI